MLLFLTFGIVTKVIFTFSFTFLITDPIVKNNISSINENPCCICPLAKLHRLPSLNNIHTIVRHFELIHYDLWKPCSTAAYDGSKYFLAIVDDFTRTTWLYLPQNKIETQKCIEAFSNLETQFNLKIHILKSDNGNAFHMKDFLNTKGIIHQKTCVASPQQNGIVERKHQHVHNVARAIKF